MFKPFKSLKQFKTPKASLRTMLVLQPVALREF